MEPMHLLRRECQPPVTVQAQGEGAPRVMPPLDSQSLSCLRVYGSATRPIAFATSLVEAQRCASWP